MLGIGQDELLGQAFLQWVSEDDKNSFLSYFKSVSEESSGQPAKFKLIRANGDIIYAQPKSSLIKDEHGNPAWIDVALMDATECEKIENELRYRIEFEKLISMLSTNFINRKADEVDPSIYGALKLLGEFADVDRSYIFLFSKGLERMNCTHEWYAPGIKSEIENLRDIKTDKFRWFMDKITKLEVVYVPKVIDMPQDAETEKNDFLSFGIKSLINIPMVHREKLIGFVGFDSVRTEKEWKEDIINLLKLVGEMFVDALERKKTEEALREGEEKYRTMIEHSNDMIWTLDVKGDFTYFNKRAEEISGYSLSDWLGKSFAPLIHQADMPKIQKIFLETTAGKPAHYDISVYKKDGTIFVLSVNTAPIYKNGKIVGTVSFGRDITENRKAQTELRESENRYRAMFENTGTATVIIEEDRTISLVNTEFEKLSGYSKNEVEGGKKFEEFVAKEDLEKTLEYHNLRRTNPAVVPRKYEIDFIDKNGLVRNVIVTADIIPGTRKGIVSVQDITEHKLAEEQLAKARQTAEQRAKECEEAKRILETLMEHIPEGITIADAPDVKIRMVSKYGQEMIGHPRELIEGITADKYPELWRLFHTDGITPAGSDEFPLVRATKYGEVITNEEWIMQKPDGKIIMILINAAPIRDKDGKISGGAIAWRDVTERKQAQEKLKQSYEKLQKSIDGIINAIVKIVETRDPYTAGHEKRVSQLASAIAKEMGLSEDRINGIRMAGVIHDIGKIYVPAEILSKPGSLSEMEFAIIKIHPQASYEILKVIDFPWPIAQVALQHQERLNGSGYPLGLSGENILLEARILAVADVVEAMTFNRPYRSAVGIDKALEEISKNKGILYDPKVVDACMALFNEKKFQFESIENPPA